MRVQSILCAGIDPAYAKGIAIAYRLRSGAWMLHKVPPNERALLRSCLAAVTAAGIETAILEDIYQGPNVVTYGLLAEVRGRVKDIAEEVGLHLILVKPSEWHPKQLLVSGDLPRRRPDIKARSLWVAKNVHHAPVGKDDDLADAVCLAEFGSDMLSHAERVIRQEVRNGQG